MQEFQLVFHCPSMCFVLVKSRKDKVCPYLMVHSVGIPVNNLHQSDGINQDILRVQQPVLVTH